MGKLKVLPQETLQKLDDNLVDKSYVNGDNFTDADVLLFSHLCITNKASDVTTEKEQGFPNISRWESHVRNLLSSNQEDASFQPKKLPKEDMKGVKKLYGLA